MFKVNDKINQNIKEWEELILQATRFADKQDLCNKLEIYKDLGQIQSDLYRLKAMNGVKLEGTDSESVSRNKYTQKIYRRLKQNVDSSEVLQSIKEPAADSSDKSSDGLAAKFSLVHDSVIRLSSASKGEFISDVDSIINMVDLKIEDYSNWSKDQLNKQDEDFSVSFNKHLNELQYHRDNVAGWLKKVKDESSRNLAELKKELENVLDNFQKAWKSLSSLKSIGGGYAYQ